MEGDYVDAIYRVVCDDFYPRPHMEGDKSGLYTDDEAYNFYPRPHMEGDRMRVMIGGVLSKFLPTPSHGGRPLPLPAQSAGQRDFYPRPHMEGDSPAGGLRG